MITKYQRHPTDAACVILHVSGVLGPFAHEDGTTQVVDQEYRDALEAANVEPEHSFFGKLED